MINERLERALDFCKKNDLDPTRLKIFNREFKKKRFKKKKGKFFLKKAEKQV